MVFILPVRYRALLNYDFFFIYVNIVSLSVCHSCVASTFSFQRNKDPKYLTREKYDLLLLKFNDLHTIGTEHFSHCMYNVSLFFIAPEGAKIWVFHSALSHK